MIYKWVTYIIYILIPRIIWCNYYIITNNISYHQNFESGTFIPEGWNHPPSSFSWESTVIGTGINCYPTTVAYAGHYWQQYPGEEAYLITNKIKLGGGNLAENILIYDYAYAGYSSGYNDGFRIDISKDCGITWDSIYGAYGADLQTTDYANYSWYPTCGSWKKDTINLSNYGYNADTIMMRFVAINDYGNNFFLDNIKINGNNITSLEDKYLSKNFSLYPNPNDGKFVVETTYQHPTLEIIDISGRIIFSEKIIREQTDIDIKEIKPGFYIAQLILNGEVAQQKLIIK